MIKRVFFVLALFAACLRAVGDNDRKFVLVIDAGHGGRDAGALGSSSKEKDINLDVALAFGRYVESNNPDVRVVYTRKSDVFVPLYERAEIANRNKADLFVSVHTNALPRGKVARGFETYTLGDGRSQGRKENLEVAKRENSVILMEENYRQHYVGYDPNSPESNIMFEFVQDKNLSKSVDLARMMQKHVCRMASRPDKGVHQSNLAVLRLASMPACLLELGFITTPDEERLLCDKRLKDRMALGIYNAFVEYKNKHYNGIVVPYKTESPAIDESSETVGDAPAAQADEGGGGAVPMEQERQPVMEGLSVEGGERLGPPDRPVERPSGGDASVCPVFKIQILASGRSLKPGDKALKGLDGCECYEEGGMMKYTYGSSADYNEVYRLRKQILDKFPGAFIIAFKAGSKMDVNQAIREFKQNRRK